MTVFPHRKAIIAMTFVTVFMDSLNNSLVGPILPYIILELESTPFQEGVVYSAYSLMQLISLLLMGPLSDRYGRKPFLILSLFGSCFGSILQGTAYDMWLLILWRALTGLFAGSMIIAQSVISDVTDASERNVFVARLASVNSIAYVLGPAISGALSFVNLRFPFFVAGVASGIAFVLAFFLLWESNATVLRRRELKKKGATKKEIATEEQAKTEETERKEAEKKQSTRTRVPFKPIMVLCFILEFCTSWTSGCYNSRYAIYLNEKFGVSTSLFSTLLCIQGVWCFLLQSMLYPWLTTKLNLPIPHLATLGMLLEAVCHVLIALAQNTWMGFVPIFFYLLGWSLVCPASVSILSTNFPPTVIGRLLSWNNFCMQTALIISPIILAQIYSLNRESVYYFTAGVCFVGFLIIGYVSTWKNSKELGKKVMYKEIEAKTTELPIVSKEATNEVVSGTIPDSSVPPKDGLSVVETNAVSDNSPSAVVTIPEKSDAEVPK